MDIKIDSSWAGVLTSEFEKPYFKELLTFVNSEYENYSCYPPKEKIFAAFNHCPFDKVRAVIIGQDPYHGDNQANGLCFSVNEAIPFPPSLKNIFKEIQQDLNQGVPTSGNLERWASQGVLLLNATLTVRKGEAGSHQNKGWEIFTDAVIQHLAALNEKIVFMLWGGYAKKKGVKIDRNKHKILESGHPSPLSANKGHWFGNKHFSQTNAFLKSIGKTEIVW